MRNRNPSGYISPRPPPGVISRQGPEPGYVVVEQVVLQFYSCRTIGSNPTTSTERVKMAKKKVGEREMLLITWSGCCYLGLLLILRSGVDVINPLFLRH